MSLQIFIPNKSGNSPDYLREVGLGDLLRLDAGDSGPQSIDVVANGPGNQRGSVFYWLGSESHPGYHPQSQTWVAAKLDKQRQLPAGRFWLCLDGATPDTLVRDESCRLAGYFVELADGNRWVVPNGMLLPMRPALDDTGSIVKLPARKFEAIHNRTLWALSAIEALHRQGTEIPYAESVVYAAEMLSLNYRVNLEICDALGLFDDQNIGRILFCSTDRDRLLAIADDLKKNAAASNSNG
jgi:hypothetical protein